MKQYWAYIHQYGRIAVKEWYEGNKFIYEASVSPYIKKYLEKPFEAESSADAEEIATKLLSSKNDITS